MISIISGAFLYNSTTRDLEYTIQLGKFYSIFQYNFCVNYLASLVKCTAGLSRRVQ